MPVGPDDSRNLVARLPPPYRLPQSIVEVELSCIRDTLPPPLSQLAGLRTLHVRRGVVSEGVLLTEYEALSRLTRKAPGGKGGPWSGWQHFARLLRRRAARPLLTGPRCLPAGLTALSLEQQEEEAWLLPPELLTLTALRALSFSGNDCS